MLMLSLLRRMFFALRVSSHVPLGCKVQAVGCGCADVQFSYSSVFGAEMALPYWEALECHYVSLGLGIIESPMLVGHSTFWAFYWAGLIRWDLGSFALMLRCGFG
ncbi:hypothetical protein Nepgr_015859 [Nepenthes gracilis]|uniref:Secreted protein n=1 Tax=Nepenthes gracilis TaxID=150966 RepID=A0AAD3SMH4_NEPGR|nr:hypothetical protein Nepgr_015859 [Nepenthes gracilis]